jgi:hypothetical protein
MTIFRLQIILMTFGLLLFTSSFLILSLQPSKNIEKFLTIVFYSSTITITIGSILLVIDMLALFGVI